VISNNNPDDLREIRREIERIKDRIDDIGHIQALQVRALGEVKKLVLSYFSGPGATNKARIYLAADGSRSVSEIAAYVEINQGYVTRKCQEMFKLGLLGWQSHGRNKCYHKTIVERALHLSSDLESIADDS
jgi:hypothetical protein